MRYQSGYHIRSPQGHASCSTIVYCTAGWVTTQQTGAAWPTSLIGNQATKKTRTSNLSAQSIAPEADPTPSLATTVH